MGSEFYHVGLCHASQNVGVWLAIIFIAILPKHMDINMKKYFAIGFTLYS